MKTATAKPEEKSWRATLSRELREAQQALTDDRAASQEREAARTRALRDGIRTWWAELEAEWRAAADALRGSVGHLIVTTEPLGRLEIRAVHGTAGLSLDADGWLKTTTLVLGSGGCHYVELVPGEAGIEPRPVELVQGVLERFFRQLAQIGRKEA